jgi:hypothetical protein
MVDDDATFRELTAAVAQDADLAVITLGVEELARRRAAEGLPRGVMLDGSALTGTDAVAILAEVPRIVICTAREYRHIAPTWVAHPNVRVLLKPMDLAAFQAALQWLAGASEGTSWPTPNPGALPH